MKAPFTSFPFFLPVLSSFGLALSLHCPALAADLSPVELSQIPEQANPGLLNPNSMENIPYNQQPQQQEQLLAPKRDLPQNNLEVPEPPSIVQLNGSQFHVNKIRVEGNTLLAHDTFTPILANVEGKDVSLNDLEQVVEKMNEQYRKRGYFTSLAYIPPQDISHGNIVIKILEGQVGNISVAGNKFYRTGVIARYLDQGTGDPLNIPELEKNLRRINRQGDFRVRATLSPDHIAGKTDIRLDVEERQPYQVGLTFDDQGRPTIGVLRWGTEFIDRNVSGIGDRFDARWIGATGTQTALASYFVPLNRYGTELGTSFSFSDVNVKLPNIHNQPPIIGQSFNYSLILSQALDREHIFVADTSMNFNRTTSFYDGNRTSQDDIRSLAWGLNFDKFDSWGHTFARAQTSVGIDWMGGDRQFWKANTLLNRTFRLPKNNMLILRSYAQFTPDALPIAEAFQLGGEYSVRGYSEGLLTGDRGYEFSVEHRWPIPGLTHVNAWLGNRLQGATFFDYGRSWTAPTNVIHNQYNSLASAGLGVRARLTQYMQGFVDFGFGLQNRSTIEPYGQPTAMIHFGVRSDLLPDDYHTWGNKVADINVKPHFKRRAKKIEDAKKAISSATKPNNL